MATTSPLEYFRDETVDLLFLMGGSISLVDFLAGLPLFAPTVFVFVFGDAVSRFFGTGETDVLLFFCGDGEADEEDSEVESGDFAFFLGDDVEEVLSEAFLFLGEDTDEDSFEDETGEDGRRLFVSVRPLCAFSAVLFTGLVS